MALLAAVAADLWFFRWTVFRDVTLLVAMLARLRPRGLACLRAVTGTMTFVPADGAADLGLLLLDLLFWALASAVSEFYYRTLAQALYRWEATYGRSWSISRPCGP